MEKRILKPLSEFILDMGQTDKIDDECFSKIFDYTRFITQPISLGQFIACDKEGKPLVMPENFNTWSLDMILPAGLGYSVWYNACKQFQEAQERVIFKGFECTVNVHGDWWVENRNGVCIKSSTQTTLEDLTHLNLELTDNALNR